MANKLPLPAAGSTASARPSCTSWPLGTAACPPQLQPLARPLEEVEHGLSEHQFVGPTSVVPAGPVTGGFTEPRIRIESLWGCIEIHQVLAVDHGPPVSPQGCCAAP